MVICACYFDTCLRHLLREIEIKQPLNDSNFNSVEQFQYDSHENVVIVCKNFCETNVYRKNLFEDCVICKH